MNKKLVFHFYVKDKNWDREPINKIHLECLRHYSSVFTEVIMVCALDKNATDKDDIIRGFKRIMIDIFPLTTLTCEIIDNDPLFRECVTFKKYVADKIGEDDSLVFFAHGKGGSDSWNPNLIHWIMGSYWLSLHDINDVETTLVTYPYISQGSFLMKGDSTSDMWGCNIAKNKWHYAGAFFWINMGSLSNYISKYNLTLPLYNNRWYVEMFLGNLIPAMMAYGYQNKYLIVNSGGDIYNNCEIAYFISDKNDREDYNQLIKKINKKGININKL